VAGDRQLDWEGIARASVHPLKLRILETMADGERWSPSDLATELGAPVGNVAYHVRALREGGLLTPAGRRQRRGAVQHFYRLAANAIA
jgi:DNA-binding transcriptional ArsR family regulator